MKPYWITTEGGALGIGVTARSEEDAREIVLSIFPAAVVSRINVLADMRSINPKHAAPNIEPNWMIRGIWFPRGFQ